MKENNFIDFNNNLENNIYNNLLNYLYIVLQYNYNTNLINKKKPLLKKINFFYKIQNITEILFIFYKKKNIERNKFIIKHKEFLLKNLNLAIKKYFLIKTNKIKTRSKVSYSNKKLWRQKGLGKARVGSKKSPLLRGGGVIFGPLGLKKKKKLNKKLKILLFFSIFICKMKNILIFKDLISIKQFIKTNKKKKNLILYNNFIDKKNKKYFFYLKNFKNYLIKDINNLNFIDLIKNDYFCIKDTDLFLLFNKIFFNKTYEYF